jgi:hypothetical protein
VDEARHGTRAVAAGLDGITITDQETGEWVDEVKEAARKHSLVVFPSLFSELSRPLGRYAITATCHQ